MALEYSKMNPFFTEAELSKLMGTTRKTLQRWRNTGEGPPFIKFGQRTIRYPKDRFKLWVEENTQT